MWQILWDGQPELKEVQHRILQVKDALRSSWLHPNVFPYQAMVSSTLSSILVRQHFLRNLKDRLHTRPFLSMLEKKWLAFQGLAMLELVGDLLAGVASAPGFPLCCEPSEELLRYCRDLLAGGKSGNSVKDWRCVMNKRIGLSYKEKRQELGSI
eukprot:s1248_g7.t1